MAERHILIVAGEASGDLHTEPVVRALQARDPSLRFFGTGGAKMRSAGVELLADVSELAVMGFSSIPSLLPRLARLKKQLIQEVVKREVSLVITVDYPGFNLNLARGLKGLPHPPRILHYIAPQVWAWRAGRVHKMARVLDHLAVIFPFELPLFERAGLPTTFVGNPLIDELADIMPTAIRPFPASEPKLLALLPGSRRDSIQRLLPLLLTVAKELQTADPLLQVAIGRAPGVDSALYDSLINQFYPENAGSSPRIELCDNSHQLLLRATAAAVCSGTATLETALLQTPQVVVYKTSPLNYMIASRLVKLPNISLVNITAGAKIVPELVQGGLTAPSLTNALLPLLADSPERQNMITDYTTIRLNLGTPGAAERVADIAVKLLVARSW